jgi:Tol biopolymer transport system component
MPLQGKNVTEVSAKETEFLSNEAIEGELLAERLANGGLPAEDALRYALDIGHALNRAHKRGAVHGKLSPHSILLTATGARIVRPVDGKDLDALAYRSPEQIAGATPDWRSDVFSFGTLLYEMVSGRRAFAGEGAALDRAIQEKPPATLMSKSPIHAAMEGVIAGCIEKDPARRRQRIQNAVIELRLAGRSIPRFSKSLSQDQPVVEFAAGPQASGIPGDETDIRPKRSRIFTPVRFPEEIQAVPGKGKWQRRMLWTLLPVSFLLTLSGAWILWNMAHAAPVQVVAFPVAPPENTSYRMPAISPDGRNVVLQSAGPEGKPMLWLRALDVMKPKVIPGTEGAFAPFWSPDSQYIAFFADKALKKIRVGDGHISDGHIERICDAEPLPGGGSWNRDGIIVFSPGQGSSLYRVPASGGTPQLLQKLNTAAYEHAHLWPQFLPDGNHFVFFVLSDSPAATGVYVGSLDSHDYSMLFQSETNAVYSPPTAAGSAKHGYLLYIRDRSLVGVGFNASRLQLVGESIPLQDEVRAVQSLSLAPISISQNAVLVYQTVPVAKRQLAWVDRTGKTLATVAEGGGWGPPRISPDGTRAVSARAGKADDSSSDLWLIDQKGTATQFTQGPGHKGSPVWSPDGSRIAYASEIDGNYDIVVSPANAVGRVEPLIRTAEAKYPSDWSHDGKFLLFTTLAAGTKSDIWGVAVTDRHSGPVLDTIYQEGYGTLSPDGKWLAFQSDEREAGHNQVYVQPYDGISRGTKRHYEISGAAGGGLPHWRADGKELFYITNGGRVMSVSVHPEGDEFKNDAPQPLFQTRPISGTWNLFDASPDGDRFLMNLPLEWPTSSPIAVMTNWTEKVKE